MLRAREECRLSVIVMVIAVHCISSMRRLHGPRGRDITDGIELVESSSIGLVCGCRSIGLLPHCCEVSAPHCMYWWFLLMLRVRKGLNFEIVAVLHDFAVSFVQTLYVSALCRYFCWFLDLSFCPLLIRVGYNACN